MSSAAPSPETSEADTRPRNLWPAVLGLGVTQLIGWGSTFSALGILGVPIARDLGLPREVVFGGMSVMLLVAAVMSPEVGRRIDRDGARSVMVPGTLLGAFALLVIACAHGPILLLSGWAIFGATVAMMMNNAAVPALVDIAGVRSRQAVTTFTIITGITGTIFLPLTAWLEARYGWRTTLLIYSLLFLVICLPVHLAVLPATRLGRQTAPKASDPQISWDGDLSPARRRIGLLLLGIWMSLQSFIVWGFNVQSIDILSGLGLTLAEAVFVWSFGGPAQALVRVADVASGGRTSAIKLAVASTVCLPVAMLVLGVAGLSVPIAILLALMQGAGQGLHAVARTMMPLKLFGLKTFATTMGRLALPLNICTAAAPLVYSAVISRLGPVAALQLTATAAAFSLCSVLLLAKIVRQSEGSAT